MKPSIKQDQNFKRITLTNSNNKNMFSPLHSEISMSFYFVLSFLCHTLIPLPTCHPEKTRDNENNEKYAMSFHLLQKWLYMAFKKNYLTKKIEKEKRDAKKKGMEMRQGLLFILDGFGRIEV
jgi:hypothetical protein